MNRKALLTVAALAVLLAGPASAASLTPPSLVQATGAANADLMLIWPTASTGPLEAISYANLKALLNTDLSFLRSASNLSDLGSATTARTNLGLGTAALLNTGISGMTVCVANAVCTLSGTQTFTVAPVFTDASGSRTALGLGTAATVNTGTSGGTLCLANAVCTASAERLFAASTTGAASINVPQGVAPTSPANGDVWTTSSGVFVRIAGATQALGTVVSGTWTPTITYATPGNLSVAYTDQRGTYTKAGTICTAQFNVRFTPTFTTASGDLIIGGLPVARSQANSTTFEADGGNILPNYNFTGLGNVIVYTSTATSGLTTSQFNLESGITDVKATNTTSGSAWWAAGSFTYAC